MARGSAVQLSLLWLGLLFVGPACAGLVPSLVNSGDCVADIISIPYSPERQPFDEQYCREGNPSDVNAYQVCLANSALNDTRFFTDRCGEGDEYYLAVNGVEHVLQRVGPSWLGVNLSGRFAGDGLELEVLPLKQSLEPPSDGPAEGADNEDVESGSWSVQITLRQGGETRTFTATLLYGP